MVPVTVWQQILSSGVVNHTGYTHQWRSEFAQGFIGIVQASCDGFVDFMEASTAGWKCFLVKPANVDAPKGTAHCAASVEKGQKTTCSACHLCDGSSAHIVINAHGKSGAKVVW
jgi:cytochrome c553